MMQQYRAYLVGENGVFQSAEAFEARSDASALLFARRFTRRGDVEVWQLGRKIGLLKAAAPSAAASPDDEGRPGHSSASFRSI
ncbi:hypothetical protein A5906_33980 [Bradyrhizobium sacchari]|uniref:Uncharacterized protein n=1 Tax=Bradyrhizobium sacchari TaxID=1399419 RepID=A0A560JN15_9BRAD|nr:hypothetical protein [Bradyrhizobium sacchari]OPY97970.1 hypothetical protein A5906_33980 [Bradyrhizobium sacchari]TWB59077.1 hypothetical protein FBZ94_105353 [Bradyrhizobium sacchari]TWB72563.1 hypothetical protein FBZ95_106278 [Bradyrhizobium sacchari]